VNVSTAGSEVSKLVHKFSIDRRNQEKMDTLFTSCFSVNVSDPRHCEEMRFN
jgi:hypothetical protein